MSQESQNDFLTNESVFMDENVAKKARKRPLSVINTEAVEDIEEIEEMFSVGFSNPPCKLGPKQIVKKKAGFLTGGQLSCKKSKTVEEVDWQKAMDLAVQILQPLKVDIKELTLVPDAYKFRNFRKAMPKLGCNDKKIHLNLTFSTQKTVTTLMGRFIFSFVLRAGGMAPSNWNPTGCVIWNHKCLDNLKCFHGLTMVSKDQLVEMDVTSENAQRALKETPQKAKITTNRWGRSIVQLKNEDAACCFHDASCNAGTFSNKSCGLFYTEGQKALQAFKQIMEFQKACYPKMANAMSHLLLPIKCDCNWGTGYMPLLGRQMCKVTPFSMSAAANVEKHLIDDPKLLATVQHPSILVFQCCNPVYRHSKANPQKNCDFKISAPDVILALQLAKQMWSSLINCPVPLVLEEFKWQTQYQYQNTILPVAYVDTDESLF
ncbi:DNA binding protein [Bovine adenovirus 10]|uniref:DNA-binding protein n=1 Tax=Bovine adenovirus C serotype 10 TaxID=39788 RepID=A0A9X9KRV3_ADEBA|nr:DNA binding protein [Bovine adenovirus 10]